MEKLNIIEQTYGDLVGFHAAVVDGEDTKGIATLDATLIPNSLITGEEGEVIFINRLFVGQPIRNKGIAKRLLDNLCMKADLLEKKIEADVSPYDRNENSKSRLITLFESYGFKSVVKDAPEIMVRQPK